MNACATGNCDDGRCRSRVPADIRGRCGNIISQLTFRRHGDAANYKPAKDTIPIGDAILSCGCRSLWLRNRDGRYDLVPSPLICDALPALQISHSTLPLRPLSLGPRWTMFVEGHHITRRCLFSLRRGSR